VTVTKMMRRYNLLVRWTSRQSSFRILGASD
jgi:hypothetical protein